MEDIESNVSLITITPGAEKLIAKLARVSSPQNQVDKENNYAGLLKYCIRNKHWSIFEQASATLEINTSLAIATQILRHRSFCFQQFSQRYAKTSTLSTDGTPMFKKLNLRRQDSKNRQNSTDDLPEKIKSDLEERGTELMEQCFELYGEMLEKGVAKECARFILPQASKTRLYMTGNIRSWIHYIDLRSGNGTQREHMEVALQCKRIFIGQLPIIARSLGWTE